jgi:hypothetical protein
MESEPRKSHGNGAEIKRRENGKEETRVKVRKEKGRDLHGESNLDYIG